MDRLPEEVDGFQEYAHGGKVVLRRPRRRRVILWPLADWPISVPDDNQRPPSRGGISRGQIVSWSYASQFYTTRTIQPKDRSDAVGEENVKVCVLNARGQCGLGSIGRRRNRYRVSSMVTIAPFVRASWHSLSTCTSRGITEPGVWS